MNNSYFYIETKLKKAKISMDKDEFVEEHKHLVKVLESPSRKDDIKEAKDQKEELKQEVGKSDDENPNPRLFIARKIEKLVQRRPDMLDKHPEWQHYADNPMEAQAAQTRQEHIEETPGAHKDKFDKEYEKENEELDESPADKSSKPASLVKGKDGFVASIAVMDGDKILMGKRKDNGKWTTPGGHLEAGETKEQGAKRELKEEAGLDAKNLKHLGDGPATIKDGKELTIHAFVVDKPKQKPTSKKDPDKEVSLWEWIDTAAGLPEHVAQNLHSRKNILLQKLGLQKSLESRPQPNNTTPVVNEVAPPSAMEVTTAPFNKSVAYIVDVILKSRPHKYIRKYMRNGSWVYIYHEGDQHGRALPEEAVRHLKALSEDGNLDAKELHDSIEAHDEEKLKVLRELADLGNKDAKEHLIKLGIDRDREKMEEAIIPVASQDPIDRVMKEADAKKAHLAAFNAVKKTIFDHLNQYSDSPYTRTLARDGVTMDKVVEAVKGQNTLSGILNELHKQMKAVDGAHRGLPASQSSDVRGAGGYGNLAYNKAVREMERTGVLPEGYHEVHERTAANMGEERLQTPGIKKLQEEREKAAKEKAEKEAKEKAEREERERVELASVHGSMAHFMSTITGRSGSMEINEIKKLHTTLKNIFGKDFKKSDWPYNFEHKGMKTRIQSISIGSDSITMDLQVLDQSGNDMMDGWTRTWSKKGGRPHIENRYMAVRSGARTGVQVGNLINQGQRDLMRKAPRGGTIGVHANIDVGGYNWCNHGFSFDNESTLRDWKYRFQNFLKEHGVALSDEEMQNFKDPVHFAAFTDGKKYIKQIRNSVPLSADQIRTKSLTGVEGEHPLTPSEISEKRASRMAVHLGKKFTLGTDWYGSWDSSEDTDASKFAEQYYQLRDRAVEHLDNQYKEVVKKVKEGGAVYVARRDSGSSSSSSSSSSAPVHQARATSGHNAVDRYIDYWRPRSSPGSSRRHMILTQGRLSRIMSWSDAEINAFVSHAPLTSDARRTIRNKLRERGPR